PRPGEVDGEVPHGFRSCHANATAILLVFTYTNPRVTMPRPSQIDTKRRELLPILAQAFAELGYRRATTAELAARCGVQENILYRLFADKRRMFIGAIGFVYDNSMRVWQRLLAEGGDRAAGPARALLDYESKHHGELGLYRIVFAG